MKQVVKKGKHYESRKWYWMISLLLGLVNRETLQRGLNLILTKHFKRVIIFHPNAWYSRDSINKTGWNKVTGRGAVNNHENSNRLVYQADFDDVTMELLRLAQYCYIDGTRDERYMCKIKTGNAYLVDIYSLSVTYMLKLVGLDDTIYHTSGISSSGKRFMPIIQSLYFGGHSVAPHDITIYVYRVWYYKLLKKLNLLPKFK